MSETHESVWWTEFQQWAQRTKNSDTSPSPASSLYTRFNSESGSRRGLGDVTVDQNVGFEVQSSIPYFPHGGSMKSSNVSPEVLISSDWESVRDELNKFLVRIGDISQAKAEHSWEITELRRRLGAPSQLRPGGLNRERPQHKRINYSDGNLAAIVVDEGETPVRVLIGLLSETVDDIVETKAKSASTPATSSAAALSAAVVPIISGADVESSRTEGRYASSDDSEQPSGDGFQFEQWRGQEGSSLQSKTVLSKEVVQFYEFFYKKQKSQLVVWTLQTVVANDLFSDDSFVFSKTATKLKDAIAALPVVTEDDDVEEAGSLKDNAENGCDDGGNNPSEEDAGAKEECDCDPFGLDSLISTSGKGDDKTKAKRDAGAKDDGKDRRKFLKSQRKMSLLREPTFKDLSSIDTNDGSHGTFLVWDPGKKKFSAKVGGHASTTVTSISKSEDGRSLLSVGTSYEFVLWSNETHEEFIVYGAQLFDMEAQIRMVVVSYIIQLRCQISVVTPENTDLVNFDAPQLSRNILGALLLLQPLSFKHYGMSFDPCEIRSLAIFFSTNSNTSRPFFNYCRDETLTCWDPGGASWQERLSEFFDRTCKTDHFFECFSLTYLLELLIRLVIKNRIPAVGNGYTIRNVAFCWWYETGVVLGIEVDDEVLQHVYYECGVAEESGNGNEGAIQAQPMLLVLQQQPQSSTVCCYGVLKLLMECKLIYLRHFQRL